MENYITYYKLFLSIFQYDMCTSKDYYVKRILFIKNWNKEDSEKNS